MTETSFASLNPTLLARKGGAKPAMRPQLGPIPNGIPANLEDLGWNDMGIEKEKGEATIIPLTPQQAANDPVIAKPAPKKKAKRKSALKQGKRAAFTLRLDAERHLKLRLAATMRNLSAQQVVTEALDALLAEIEELDSLAAKMQQS